MFFQTYPAQSPSWVGSRDDRARASLRPRPTSPSSYERTVLDYERSARSRGSVCSWRQGRITALGHPRPRGQGDRVLVLQPTRITGTGGSSAPRGSPGREERRLAVWAVWGKQSLPSPERGQQAESSPDPPLPSAARPQSAQWHLRPLERPRSSLELSLKTPANRTRAPRRRCQLRPCATPPPEPHCPWLFPEDTTWTAGSGVPGSGVPPRSRPHHERGQAGSPEGRSVHSVTPLRPRGAVRLLLNADQRQRLGFNEEKARK